jgi:hypothetical protein
MDYTFKEVGNTHLEATQRSWESQLEQLDFELPPSRFMQVISSARQRLNQDMAVAGTGVVSWYGVFRKDEPLVAHALIEVSYARPHRNNAWLKMLNMRVEPDLDEASSVEESLRIRRLKDVMTVALEGALYLSNTSMETNTVKLWCEDSAHVQFYEMLGTNLGSEAQIQVQRHGTRWVVFNLLEEQL